MFAASFRRKTYSEYVFLCIRSSVSVCVTTVWAPTIGYLCLFLEGGALETWLPRVIGWLATVRSLLWRVLYAGFFRFQLNVECSTLEGHLKCVVCLNMCVCMCVFVCLCTLLFHFHTQRSFSKDETTSRAGKMGPEPAQLFFHNVLHVSLIPSTFAVVTLGGNEEATNTTANYYLQCQSLSSSREE